MDTIQNFETARTSTHPFLTLVMFLAIIGMVIFWGSSISHQRSLERSLDDAALTTDR